MVCFCEERPLPQERGDIWGPNGVIEQGRPVVFRASKVGPCLDSWGSAEHLGGAIGDKRVSVHTAAGSCLSFVNKNFNYEMMTINEMFTKMEASSSDRFWYFRALGTRPTKDRAQLNSLSPQLESEFVLPEPFKPPTEAAVSSIFRITSLGVELWGHYDIPENFLVQVVGTKRVRVFPPCHAANLGIKSSSSPIAGLVDGPGEAADDRVKAAFADSCTVDLGPGDILHIPACWIHATKCVGVGRQNVAELGDVSKHSGAQYAVNVNLFMWDKSLSENHIYDTKDVYGNKDLTAFQKLEASLEKDFLPEFKKMPKAFRDLYVAKITESLNSCNN
eukprot:Selendium_serpulae@DN3613_c0_g1_i1.p1